MDHIEISSEMTALLGAGPIGNSPLPADSISLTYILGDGAATPTLSLDTEPTVESLGCVDEDAFRLILLVRRSAVIRLGGGFLLSPDHRDFHLPAGLRAIAGAVREPPTTPQTLAPYRLAKCIELFCETLRLFAGHDIAPLASGGALSAADTRRVVAARRLIDEHWHEKLTLDAISRACGLNRAKLTRGFRDMFHCSIAEAIAECRLDQASRLLLTTDLRVSSIGYESGYLNNASFSRAFSRRFGRSPSDYRALGLSA